jgi:TrmH family RNA methyltransferase
MADAPRPGRVHEITSLSNPTIKAIKALAQKKNRDQEGVFLTEGLKHAVDALEQGWKVRTLIYTKSMAAHDLASKTAASARSAGADILEVSEKVLASITRRDNPQAVVCVVEQRWHEAPKMMAQHSGKDDLLLVLDRVRDPGNLGTIIRTLDGAGARKLLLVGECTDPFALEAVRASMGSVFHVYVSRCTQEEFLRQRTDLAGQVFGTHLEGAVDWRSPDYTQGPVTLIMGNERSGMPPELAEACDTLVRIPMAGGADSLNLAVATGLSIYEARRHLLDADAPTANESRPLTYGNS